MKGALTTNDGARMSSGEDYDHLQIKNVKKKIMQRINSFSTLERSLGARLQVVSVTNYNRLVVQHKC